MKILIPIFVLFVGALAREGTTDDAGDIKPIFDNLLEVEGIKLDPDDYEERLAIFVLNFLAGDDEDDVNEDMMFTDEELQRMNGAKLIGGLKLETMKELKEREKLEEREVVEVVKRRRMYADNRRYLGPAISQMECGNCYIHTVIAALEAAYFKATGRKVKFSEQEWTDCYFSGCDGGDFRLVPLTMALLDKASTKAGYGPYFAKVMTCRGAVTPDALKLVKIKTVVGVTPETVEDAVDMYGSVMTCMAWASKPGQPCYMRDYRKGTIADWPSYDKSGACAHAVLIVGYGPGYFLVRNSHGVSWGDGGHFKIKRTACGIQDVMAAIKVETRASKGDVEANGCPADKPYLCSKINACSSVSGCKTPLSEVEKKEAVEEEVVLEKEEEEVAERDLDEEIIDLEKREVRIPGERERRDEEGRGKKRGNRIPGKLQRMLAKRGVSAEDLENHFAKRSDDEIENIEKRCADRSSICARLKAMGRLRCAGGYLKLCAKTCNACGSIPKPKPKPSGETQGECLRPDVPNGRALNRAVLRPGEKLNVRCNPGYNLVGETAKCLIQEIFTNADKDARLTPECVEKGSETLVGNGADYAGTKDSYKVRGMSFECDSWNKEVLRGIVTGVSDAGELRLGNHNYCRNPGGKRPVPFCLGAAPNDIGSIRFCFGHPGCDTCVGVSDTSPDLCALASYRRYCLFEGTQSEERVKYTQSICAATCCRIAGC